MSTQEKPVKGLKDHEIQELVNAIRDSVAPITKHQCLRELVHRATMEYLEGNDLRIDKKD